MTVPVHDARGMIPANQRTAVSETISGRMMGPSSSAIVWVHQREVKMASCRDRIAKPVNFADLGEPVGWLNWRSRGHRDLPLEVRRLSLLLYYFETFLDAKNELETGHQNTPASDPVWASKKPLELYDAVRPRVRRLLERAWRHVSQFAARFDLLPAIRDKLADELDVVLRRISESFNSPNSSQQDGREAAYALAQLLDRALLLPTPPAPPPEPPSPRRRRRRRRAPARPSLEVDLGAREARWGATKLEINAQSDFAVLSRLWRTPGTVVAHRDLLREIKPDEAAGRDREAPQEVRDAANHIRKALRDVGASWEVQAVRGVGYKLVQVSSGGARRRKR